MPDFLNDHTPMFWTMLALVSLALAWVFCKLVARAVFHERERHIKRVLKIAEEEDQA